jgi:hypothetical protein
MVCFILVYVAYFALLGNKLFETDIEGAISFSDYPDSFWSMFVLLTTANFPDIMLPTYLRHRNLSLFFTVFEVFGLFLFMNMLLAIFYESYSSGF